MAHRGFNVIVSGDILQCKGVGVRDRIRSEKLGRRTYGAASGRLQFVQRRSQLLQPTITGEDVEMK
jgi:hypothetical protein